jgi:uncharacterized integral membrane protein
LISRVSAIAFIKSQSDNFGAVLTKTTSGGALAAFAAICFPEPYCSPVLKSRHSSAF